jgi:glutaredoxin
MRKVTLYTRVGCHLCDDAKSVLDRVRRRTPFELDIQDIDGNPELLRLYNEEVPVIAIDGVKAFKYRLTEDEFLRKLKSRR